MFIPMPFSIPRSDGPGSPYAMRMKPWLQAVLVGQTICVAVKLCVMLDIMGGFIDAIVVGMGWYAVSQDMNIQWICYYAMMAVFQGVFGLVRFIDTFVHWPGPFLVPLSLQSFPAFCATFWANFIQLSGLIGPILMIIGTYMGWQMYKEFTTGVPPEGASGSWGSYSSSARASERSPLRPAGPSFKAFQGNGNKLGSV
eukprot:gnl/MRDRNA2_/MRDRNA2_102688_c0_seq1.p1 gnl/MRDRNA2_/MRDRNA2_102688_c0~~gnl/MRDRNA2_/MRDRNA2_102688_c0_seq1.p1  ORF type:complete len:221 (+),score=22.67 gnl/MRDRNA2_/MRDRNA2_102688_c0_seq1:72-665(+)